MLSLIIFLLTSAFSRIALGQFRSQSIFYSSPENCTGLEYFNRYILRCQNCPNSTIPSASRLECTCPFGKRKVSSQSQIHNCDECPPGTFASPDQTECLKCRNGTCQCSESNVLSFRDQSGGLLEEGAFCAPCVEGYRKLNDETCERCEDGFCVCQNCSNTDKLSSRIKLQSGREILSLFIEKILPFAVNNCRLKNIQACEQLVNFCALQNYEYSPLNSCGQLDTIKHTTFNPWQNSWDPMTIADDSEIEKDNAIEHQYTFEKSSKLDLVFAKYDINGTFNGFIGNLPYCQLGRHFEIRFGRLFTKKCQIKRNDKINGDFFEAFIRFSDPIGMLKIYPIHVLNSAIRVNNELVNRLNSNRNRWILTRRFFVIEDYSLQLENSTTMHRYASKIQLHVTLQDSQDGFISPPYLSIEYKDSQDEDLETSFEIIYEKDSSSYDQKIVIFLSVFSPLSIFWSAICSYSWGRRMGKTSAVDASSIIYFFFCEISVLGDVFFIIFSIVAIWVTFAYKSQTYVFYNMLSLEQEFSVFSYFIAALALKFVGLVFTMGALVFQETFFIDWERDKLKKNVGAEGVRISSIDLEKMESEPPVVWRTYLIANEWNELQQYRKTSLSLQLMLVTVVLEYFQYKNWALIEPGFQRYDVDTETSRSTILSRLGVTSFIYIFIVSCQWLVQVIVVERIIIDPFHNFIDLCSISNISVLSLTHSLFGFYIHGRSAHGKGDAGMSEMNMFLQRERDNLCGNRGLEPSSDLQTFRVNLPLAFRTKYDEISTISRQPVSGTGHDAATAKMNITIEAHSKMSNFLKTFIDHSTPQPDYRVRDRSLLESILDAEMNDTSITGSFTRDASESSFSQCFVYGNEWAWTSFECLTVCVFYIWSDSIIFACFVVYMVSNFLRILFGRLSTAHLVKTSLIDQRFLI